MKPVSRTIVPSKTNYVYHLVNPVTGDPFYVGKTNSPEQRLSQHLSCKDGSKRAEYIQGLLEDGIEPVMQLVFECKDDEEASEVEIAEIAELLLKGFNLQNHTDTHQIAKRIADKVTRDARLRRLKEKMQRLEIKDNE